MENDFLPPDYEVPKSGGNYMKFQQGENKFRFLDKPIMGAVFWTETADGKKPVRVRPGESIEVGDVPDGQRPKHFWAAPVFDYRNKQIAILEITQKMVLTALVALARNPKWGSPRNYDIVVTRKGEGLDTEYIVTPEPPTPLAADIQQLWDSATIEMEALYDGGDPFAANEVPATQAPVADEINLDDIPL